MKNSKLQKGMVCLSETNFSLEDLSKSSYLLKGFTSDIIIDLSNDYINLKLPEDCNIYTTSWNTSSGITTRINSGDFKGIKIKSDYLDVDDFRGDYSLAIKLDNYSLFIVYLSNKLLIAILNSQGNTILNVEKEVK